MKKPIIYFSLLAVTLFLGVSFQPSDTETDKAALMPSPEKKLPETNSEPVSRRDKESPSRLLAGKKDVPKKIFLNFSKNEKIPSLIAENRIQAPGEKTILPENVLSKIKIEAKNDKKILDQDDNIHLLALNRRRGKKHHPKKNAETHSRNHETFKQKSNDSNSNEVLGEDNNKKEKGEEEAKKKHQEKIKKRIRKLLEKRLAPAAKKLEEHFKEPDHDDGDKDVSKDETKTKDKKDDGIKTKKKKRKENKTPINSAPHIEIKVIGYRLRYSLSPIKTEDDWKKADAAPAILPLPEKKGTHQGVSLPLADLSLPVGTKTVYFSIRYVNASGQISPLSNSLAVSIGGSYLP